MVCVTLSAWEPAGEACDPLTCLWPPGLSTCILTETPLHFTFVQHQGFQREIALALLTSPGS